MFVEFGVIEKLVVVVFLEVDVEYVFDVNCVICYGGGGWSGRSCLKSRCSSGCCWCGVGVIFYE